MENQVSKNTGTPEEPEHGSIWRNVGKTLFLIAGLVAAWFVLEWLIGGK
jgi:hypothetical protein